MKIKTTLSDEQLHAVAREVGMQLRPAASDGYLLRPTDAMDEAFRVIGSGGRRVFAVTWAGHYAFMAALYGRDPNAVIRSTLATWHNAKHFYENAGMQQPHGHTSPMNWSPPR